MFDSGLCARPTLRARRGAACRPRPARRRGRRGRSGRGSRCDSSHFAGVVPYFSRICFCSSFVSERWMRSGAPNSFARSRAARSDSFAFVYGACGATAAMTRGWPFHFSRNARVTVIDSARSLWSGTGKVEPRLAEDGAHPARVDGRGDVGLEVVHVRERRRPAAHHLGAGEERPGPHEAGRDVLGPPPGR